MFVFLSSWDNLSQDEKCEPIPIQMGLTVKHAGISMLVTSLTDVIAFVVGTVTVSLLI